MGEGINLQRNLGNLPQPVAAGADPQVANGPIAAWAAPPLPNPVPAYTDNNPFGLVAQQQAKLRARDQVPAGGGQNPVAQRIALESFEYRDFEVGYCEMEHVSTAWR